LTASDRGNEKFAGSRTAQVLWVQVDVDDQARRAKQFAVEFYRFAKDLDLTMTNPVFSPTVNS